MATTRAALNVALLAVHEMTAASARLQGRQSRHCAFAQTHSAVEQGNTRALSCADSPSQAHCHNGLNAGNAAPKRCTMGSFRGLIPGEGIETLTQRKETHPRQMEQRPRGAMTQSEGNGGTATSRLKARTDPDKGRSATLMPDKGTPILMPDKGMSTLLPDNGTESADGHLICVSVIA
jgi:hypothetical protein